MKNFSVVSTLLSAISRLPGLHAPLLTGAMCPVSVAVMFPIEWWWGHAGLRWQMPDCCERSGKSCGLEMLTKPPLEGCTEMFKGRQPAGEHTQSHRQRWPSARVRR